jgi:putative protease
MPVLAAGPPVSPPERNHLPELAGIPGLCEVLLGHERLARWGGFETDTLVRQAESARQNGLRTVFVWDVLAGGHDIADSGALLGALPLELFDAVRVQDPGVAMYLAGRFPDWPRQLILETGNHNLPGLQAWVHRLKPERIAVSNEIPIATLAAMRRELNVAMEIPVLGRLLIFYTPRKLLSPIERAAEAATTLQRVLKNVEDGKNFPFLENRHGTFMFYEKELFLLPYLDEIRAAGIDVARLDLSSYHARPVIDRLREYRAQTTPESEQALRRCLGPRITRGFFKSNRTEKQFRKLRNPHLVRDETRAYVGTVVETRKKSYLALETREPLPEGDTRDFVIPEGDEIEHKVVWIQNLARESVTRTTEPGIWLINHGRKISSGSIAYRHPKMTDPGLPRG